MKGLQVKIVQQAPVRVDVTLQCDRGELLALVGPSGSGKSTVLRTIAGLHRADATWIRCADEIWDDANKKLHIKTQQRKVGLVFQDYALFPHKSVLENVMLASPANSRETRKTKAKALLEMTNMTGLENRKPAALSGGQRQRVALARALAREPQALLLDEPFSAVDQQTRRKLYRELASLRQSLPLPIILVTHDMTEVQLLADSLCIMHRGISLVQGKVSDVINYPRTREIARLVGHRNLFKATVIAHENGQTIYQLGQEQAITGPLLHDANPGDDACLLIAPTAISVEPDTTDKKPQVANDHSQSFVVNGTVHECAALGDELAVRLHLQNIPKSLRFRLAKHVAAHHGIENGKRLKVRVQRYGLHAMIA